MRHSRYVRDIQKMIDEIYKEKNMRTPHKEDYIYGFLVRTSAFAFKEVIADICRTTRHDDVFIKCFSWLFSLASVLDINMEDAFARRFPCVCPYCLVERCCCHITGKRPAISIDVYDIEKELTYKYEGKLASNDHTIEDYINIIHKIYPHNILLWKEMYCQKHFNKTFEELGEVHEAYTNHMTGSVKLTEVEHELADVFAWLLSSWSLTMPTSESSYYTLAINNYYKYDCPVCKSKPCKCIGYYSRSQSILIPDTAIKYLEIVNCIHNHDPLNVMHYKSLRALESAINSTTDSSIRTAISLAEETISHFLQNTDQLDAKKIVEEMRRKIK